MDKDIDKAVEKATEWLEIDGIIGVAQGEHEGKPCVTVFTDIPLSMLSTEIPAEIEGFSVILQNVGSISAQ